MSDERTVTDFRALCAELLDEVKGFYEVVQDQGLGWISPGTDSLINRAHKALAQPEPEVAGPTDAEAEQLHDNLRTPIYDQLSADTPEFFVGYAPVRPGDFARAVLSRWSLPAPAPEGERQAAPVPVAVSERLPGAEDCNAEGRCWLFSKVEKEWRLIDTGNPGVPHLKYCFSHWLPAHALPLPSGEVEA